jgi:DNA-binding MarR family transcriptional regulator
MKLPDYEDDYLLFGMLFVVSNRLQVVGDTFYEELTTKQWFTIVVLEVFGEISPTLNELADAMGSSHQNVKQLILKLESKGYVTTFTDDQDRRKTRIKLTEKHLELKEKYQQNQQEFMKKLFEHIDKSSLKSAVNVLVQLEKNILNMK